VSRGGAADDELWRGKEWRRRREEKRRKDAETGSMMGKKGVFDVSRRVGIKGASGWVDG
jgi:hypothetical protein